MSATDAIAVWATSSVTFVREVFGIEPDAWQMDVLNLWDAGDQRIAMKACKGPGKTAVLAWIIWHFLATRPHPKVAATSITGDNLADCLWAELAKWQQRSPFLLQAFEWNSGRIVARDHRETWWASARTWPRTAKIEQQAATLAGIHGDYVLFIIDEVGEIPDAVAVTAEAALAVGIEVRMVIAGNPTVCEGPLWRACNRDKAYWSVVTITGDPDSPKRSPRISLDWARKQIATYGRDNPWVMANVFGEFPPAGSLNFIGRALVDAAIAREAQCHLLDPLIMGVDVARYGDDKTVLRTRKGLDARTFPPIKLRNLDTMQVAARISEMYQRMRYDAIFVDCGGVGAGVFDRCRQLRLPVIGVDFGARADRSMPGEQITYYNKRAEIWGVMKEWLPYGAIDDDADLSSDLTGPRYAYKLLDGRDAILLESKDDMRARGLASPDDGDALALTFSFPIEVSRVAGGPHRSGPLVETEYDPFADPQPRQEYDRVIGRSDYPTSYDALLAQRAR